MLYNKIRFFVLFLDILHKIVALTLKYIFIILCIKLSAAQHYMSAPDSILSLYLSYFQANKNKPPQLDV